MTKFSLFAPWIFGILICAIGVVLVRVPMGFGECWVLPSLGFVFSGLGLLLIALGVRRRVDACQSSESQAGRHFPE